MVSTGALAPSALITKSAPSPPVRALAHSPVEPARPAACTSMRSGASALTRSSSSSLRPVPRILRDAHGQREHGRGDAQGAGDAVDQADLARSGAGHPQGAVGGADVAEPAGLLEA